MSKADKAEKLAKRAVKYLYDTNADLVEGGCADVADIVSYFLRSQGYDAEVKYGYVGFGRPMKHAWVRAEGRDLDLVLWVQGLQRGIRPKHPVIRPAVSNAICSIFAEYAEALEEYRDELIEALGLPK